MQEKVTQAVPAGRGASLEVGEVLDGRYQLLRDLGRGAAGVVFEARHLYTGRFVALKLLLPQGSPKDHAALRARMQREGRALASIKHPGIVDVLDGGVSPEGHSYLVLEMLEGRTLEGLLAARTTLSAADTAGLALQLCDALEAVHAAAVVHRDVKPGNILVLGGRSGVEVTKLLDFGVAKLLEPAPVEKLTEAGALVGTPAYMPPEQLLGDGEYGPRTDVYSLGVTMYECLSGAVPYEGNYAKILLQAAGPDPAPPLRSRAPDVTAAFALVVDRAIAKNPAHRYAGMRELADAIGQAVPGASRQTSILRPSALQNATPSPREHRRVARAPYNTPIRLVLPDRVVDGRSEDISEGGILVLSMAVCEPGQRVPIRFALPMDGRVVSVDSEVRWVRVAQGIDRQGLCAIGVEFRDLPVAVRESIASYIALMTEKAGA